MDIDWTAMLVIMVAIIGASLVEHLVIAPRMAHSPGRTLPSTTPIPRNVADYVRQHYPGAVSV